MRRCGCALRRRYGRAVDSTRLVWERAGVEQRHPLYTAVGADSLDGTPTNYYVMFNHGVWRASGDNVRRAGGVMERTSGDAKKAVARIDEAARRAYAGGFSLTSDTVMR